MRTPSSQNLKYVWQCSKEVFPKTNCFLKFFKYSSHVLTLLTRANLQTGMQDFMWQMLKETYLQVDNNSAETVAMIYFHF